MSFFLIYSGLWLLDIIFLSRLGPIGSNPLAFSSSYIIAFLLMIMMFRHCPRNWSERKVIFVIICLGLIARLAFFSFPAGNDIFRYIWEGYIQNYGFNPYLVAPDSSLVSGLRVGEMGPIWENINHKEFSGIYPPLMILLFRGLAAISPTVFFFKLTMLSFELLLFTFLVLFSRLKKVQPRYLLFYAANPFVLVYAIGEAHLDIIQAAFLVAGLFFIFRNRPFLGFVLLGSAVCSKYLAIVALPFVIRRANVHVLPALMIPALSFLPFIDNFSQIFTSLSSFGGTMHYNDGVGEIIRFFAGGSTPLLLTFLLLLILLSIYLFEHDHLRSVYLALGALLLLLPTLHPWYLLLISPFLVLYPSRAWLYLTLAVIATVPVLAIEYQTGVFQEIPMLKLIEYLPFFLLLLHDLLRRKSLTSAKRCFFPEIKAVSVIVPVLNEARNVERTIQSVRAQGVEQIIVADGGSTDNTRKIARMAGAEIVRSEPGRGIQVKAGLDEATGDAVVILHADTLLGSGALKKMMEQLNSYRNIGGGAFGMCFAEETLSLRCISGLNNLRARWLGVSFGDQAQFFRRSALKEMGGFPEMKLMEDVELALRLKDFGRPLFIPDGAQVSPRGWNSKGFGNNLWLVLHLFFRYLVERRFSGHEKIRTDYYQKYYRKSL